MKTRKFFFIFIPAFLLFAFGVFLLLGGFKKPEIKILQSSGFIIGGKAFKGNVDDQSLNELYRDTHQKYKDGILKGTFCIFHFFEPEDKEGKVDAIIGVVVKDSSVVLPKGYKYYYFQGGPIVQATITSHHSVAPSPGSINGAMKDLASKQGYVLNKGSLEKYYDDHLVVESTLSKRLVTK